MKHVRVVIAALLFVHGVVAQERADAHSKYVVPATIVEPAAPVPSAGNPPAIGVFAGASASLVDLGDLGYHGAYGWETSVSSTVYRWFAIEGRSADTTVSRPRQCTVPLWGDSTRLIW
jgi:hypothetical protein